MIKGSKVKTTNEYFKWFGKKHEGIVISINNNDVVTIMTTCGCSKSFGSGWLKLAGKTCDC